MDIEISKYEKDSLTLIYKEAIEMLNQTFKSFREANAKSYTAVGIYLSVGTFSIGNVLGSTDEALKLMFYVVAGAMLLSFIILYKNLLPSKMRMPGVLPERLIHPYYEKSKGPDQLKLYYKQRIEDLNEAIMHNKNEVDIRLKRFRNSTSMAFTLLVISVVLYVLAR